MIAVPGATAVTLPFASTVTAAALFVDHVTVVPSGVVVATSVAVPSSSIESVVLSNVTVCGITGGFSGSTCSAVTITVHVAFVPFGVVAVIVVVPAATATTLPFASTVATAVLDEFHVTSTFVGVTVAVSCDVSPISNSSVSSTVTDS